MMRWFGPAGGRAPFTTYDLEHVNPPIGELCTWCREPIASGEYGITLPHISRNADGTYSSVDRPLHDECNVRSLIGSLAHQTGACTCADPNSPHHDPPGLTRREAAKAAASLFRRSRRSK